MDALASMKDFPPDSYGAMGFRSADELRSAELGTPVECYVLSDIDAVARVLDGGKRPAGLPSYWFPVTAAPRSNSTDSTKAVIIVNPVLNNGNGGQWLATSFGSYPAGKALFTAKAKSERFGKADNRAYFLQVPAIGNSFIAMPNDESGFALIPAQSDIVLGLRASERIEKSSKGRILEAVAKAQRSQGQIEGGRGGEAMPASGRSPPR